MREETENYLEKAAVLVEALPYIQRVNQGWYGTPFCEWPAGNR